MNQRSGRRGDMGDGRIACPRCRANNFVGQAQCWQCHTPLPPAALVPASPIAPVSTWRPDVRILLPVVAVVTFGIVWFLVGRSQSPERSAPVSLPPQTLSSENSRSRPDAVPALPQENTSSAAQTNTPTAPTDSDPLTSQAQREVERARREVGLPPSAPADPNGRVHLRGGGTISAEEWEEAQRKLQQSPLLRDPPSPPPF